MLEKFLKDDGSDIVLTGEYLEIYIPEAYFESRLAEYQGPIIRTFGLLNVAIFDKGDKNLYSGIWNLPSIIFLSPSDIEDREIQIIPGEYGKVQKYIVCKFYQGDKIMPNAISQDGSNVEMFVKLVCSGKIDPSIPYTKLLNVWEKNLELNNVNLGVQASILGVILSEIYRDRKNPDVKFAKVIGKNPTVSPYAYETANIREICSRNSTFTALTFEDMDSMITSSLNMKRYGKKQVETPVEKIIKM